MSAAGMPSPVKSPRLQVDKPIVIGLGFIVVILAIGTVYTLVTQGTATFLSPTYLLQQLHFGAFLGITAAGMMMVILLGHIDLSVPWTLTAGAMLATAIGGTLGDVTCLGVGLTVGLVNGIGVAFLRVPSMIFTLGVNTVLLGLMVMLTGGHAPQSAATDLMLFLGRDRSFGVLPHSVVVWALVSLVIVFVLKRTPLGRYMYAIGNQEAAAYLSGVRTRFVIVAAFVMCSLCATIAGLALAGYSARAYQAMGDQYLLPSIAAVVLGGTNILGGRGTYSGTVVGAMLIVLLQSVLSIMQMEEGYRQIIYGLVIIGMLLIYGRGKTAER
jgi:ribose transport system permease protein